MTIGTEDKTIITDGTAITLGETYRDKLTGFKGIATSFCLFIEEPSQVHLENEMDGRWLIMSRIEPPIASVH